MKFLHRFYAFVLLSVMFAAIFSITVHADEVDTTNYKINYSVWENGLSTSQIDLQNGMRGTSGKVDQVIRSKTKYTWYQRIILTENTGDVMFKEGRKYEVNINNLYYNFKYVDNEYNEYSVSSDDTIYKMDVILTYTDGTTEGFSPNSFDYVYNSRTGSYSLIIDVKPTQDAYRLTVNFYNQHNLNNIESLEDVSEVTYTYLFGVQNSQLMHLDISVESEEVGLLGGLLDGITDLWQTTKDGFTNLVKGITDLPKNIWSFFENGLKGLFVPSEDSMTAYKDKWSNLLESRLGAVYQVANLVTESWDVVMEADQTDHIVFPLVSLEFSGVPYSFGGYDVKIVPDGFSFIIVSIKLIVGIVCTIAFVNGLRRRYDEFLGGKFD